MQLRAETSLFDDALLYGDINDAKEKADDSYQMAYNVNQYFWFNQTGSDTGAHIAYVGKDVFEDTYTGYNLLLASDAIALRYGLYTLAVLDTDSLDFYAYDADTVTNPKVASFGTSGATIGQTSANRFVMGTDSLSAYDDNNNLYFYVDESGLTYGSYTAASTNSAIGSTSTEIQYYLSTSSSSATGGSWSSSFPTWSSGYYIWTRTVITTTTIDGTSTTSYTPSSSGIYNSVLTGALSDLLDKADESDAAASVVTTAQYYLSTSASSATGGSWNSSVPTWSDGYYIWTRLEIVKTMVDGTVSTSYAPSSSGVYDSSVDIAASTATDYIYYNNGTLTLASSSPSTATRKVEISSSNISIYDDAYNYMSITSNGFNIYQGTSSANLVASFSSSLVELGKNSTSSVIQFCNNAASLSQATATIYSRTFNKTTLQTTSSLSNNTATEIKSTNGTRTSSIMATSTSDGVSDYVRLETFDSNKSAYANLHLHSTSGDPDFQIYINDYNSTGRQATISGSLESWSGYTSNITLSSVYYSTRASVSVDAASGSSEVLLQGTYVTVYGTFQNYSDKRLKKHIQYIDDNAISFIRNLKPAIFIMQDNKSMGFYAQDVEQYDPWQCCVRENKDGYKSLNYIGLIAPLVKYCQYLEQRIENLESMV